MALYSLTNNGEVLVVHCCWAIEQAEIAISRQLQAPTYDSIKHVV